MFMTYVINIRHVDNDDGRTANQKQVFFFMISEMKKCEPQSKTDVEIGFD